MPKQLILIGISVLALTAVACENIPASVGFSLSQSGGELVIHAARCSEDDLVTNIRLTDTNGTSVRDLDRAKEVVIWEIRFAQGTTQDTFTVGVLPQGAVELEPLLALPPIERWVRAYVTTVNANGKEITARESVPLSDLLPGRIRALGEQLELSEWPAYVRNEICSAPGGLISAPWS